MKRRIGLGIAIALAALAAGCGDAPVPGATPAGRRASISAGPLTLEVDTGARELVLGRGGAALLRFPADAFQLGTVAAVDDTTNYDPYRIYVPHPIYQALEIGWLDVETIDIASSSAATLELTLGYAGGKRATLAIEPERDDSLRARLTPDPSGPAVAFFRLRPRVDPTEAFYGLGEYFDDVNHRGKVRGMQLELDPKLESQYNEAHVPVPFLIGTRGWGLFVESPYPGVFSVATDADDLVEAAFGTGMASGEGLTFHLFGADRPLDVTKRYYDATATPRLPARWALGPWVWRDENDDQAQVESDLDKIRDLDLATTAYWIDRPYATAVHTFDFDPQKFTDAAAMIAKMRALGFRTALWHTPYLDEKDQADATAELRAYAEAHGFYPADTGLLLNKWGRPLDLTNPEAYAWWQDLVRTYTDMGVEGFKLDYAEDVVLGIANQREPWMFADGSDERTMHARYQLFYHRLYDETLPADGGFLLCRGGTYGDQAHVSVIWPGDLDASFARHGETTTTSGGDDYVAVGGLPASVIAGLSLGPSGFPFYGADTGGYRHSPPDKELFTRWFEQTALSSVMQIGTSSNDVAWELGGANGFDDEMLAWYREYTRLHLRLFPYEWTYAQRIAEDGRPIQRPLGLAFPELGEHPSDTYLFGDSILVAPVLERGVRERQVTLPPGRWLDWWTGEAHDGGGAITVDAPLGTLPLLLAEGGIVPMLRPTIDTIGPTTEPDRADSYATAPGLLWARIAAGPASSFTVFDGAEIAQELAGATLTLRAKPGTELAEGVVFEVIGRGAAPSSVTLDGAPLAELASVAELDAASQGWTFDAAAGGTLYVKVGPGVHEAIASGP